MSIAVNVIEPRLLDTQVTEDEIIAHLVDGRTISVPLAWSWRLSEATPDQRVNFEIIGDAQGIHWPEIDEDISTGSHRISWGSACGGLCVSDLHAITGLRLIKALKKRGFKVYCVGQPEWWYCRDSFREGREKSDARGVPESARLG